MSASLDRKIAATERLLRILQEREEGLHSWGILVLHAWNLLRAEMEGKQNETESPHNSPNPTDPEME